MWFKMFGFRGKDGDHDSVSKSSSTSLIWMKYLASFDIFRSCPGIFCLRVSVRH